jgi:hypothetical protein
MILFGLLIVTAAAPQEGGRLLRESLEKAAKAEGIAIKGSTKRLDSDEPRPPMMIMAAGVPLEGDFTAKLSEKEAEVELTSRSASLELYRRRDRTVKRVTWGKHPADAQLVIENLTRLLDFEALAHATRDADLKDPEEEMRDGKPALRIRGTLPEKLLANEDEDRRSAPEGAVFFGPKPKKIEVEAWVDKESGALVSLSFSITREMNFEGMMQKRIGGPDDMPPDEDAMPKKAEIRSKVEYRVIGTGEEHKPKIPEKLDPYFND